MWSRRSASPSCCTPSGGPCGRTAPPASLSSLARPTLCCRSLRRRPRWPTTSHTRRAAAAASPPVPPSAHRMPNQARRRPSSRPLPFDRPVPLSVVPHRPID
eukprot:165939-Prymnesium_polylepis.1